MSQPTGGNPDRWCICTCSVTGCDQMCLGNGGHNGICKCITHGSGRLSLMQRPLSPMSPR